MLSFPQFSVPPRLDDGQVLQIILCIVYFRRLRIEHYGFHVTSFAEISQNLAQVPSRSEMTIPYIYYFHYEFHLLLLDISF